MTSRRTVEAGPVEPEGAGEGVTEMTEGERFGPYELRGVLGRGTTAVVYRVRNTDRGEDTPETALKLMFEEQARDPVLREYFLRQAAFLHWSGRHDNIVRVHSHGTIDDRPYLEMEYVAGGNLADHLEAKGGRLEPAEAVALVEGIGAGLDRAHDQKAVHRDVKLANVLMRNLPGGKQPVIGDFGLVCAPDQGHTTTIGPGGFKGTPAYAAPEQWRAPSQDGIGPGVDVYALGGVLVHLLTGRTPFAGGNAEQEAAHLNMPPPRPSKRQPEVPRAMDAVIARAMAKDPKRRYRSAGALARAARRALSPRSVPRPPRRVLVAVGAMIAAATVIVGVYQGTRPTTLEATTAPLPAAVTGPAVVASGPTGPRAFVPTGSFVSIVDLASGRPVGTLPGPVSDLTVSADGKEVYLSADGVVSTYDATAPDPRTRPLGALRLPLTTARPAAGRSDAVPQLYVPSSPRVATGTPGESLYRYAGPAGVPIVVAVNPTSDRAYAIYRVGAGAEIRRIDAEAPADAVAPVPGAAAGLVVTTDGTAWTSDGGRLIAIDPENLRSQREVAVPTAGALQTLAVAGDDLYAAAPGQVFLMREGEVVASTAVPDGLAEESLAFGPDSDCGVMATEGASSLTVIGADSGCS